MTPLAIGEQQLAFPGYTAAACCGRPVPQLDHCTGRQANKSQIVQPAELGLQLLRHSDVGGVPAVGVDHYPL